MYDGNEYCQNILFKTSKLLLLFNIKSWHLLLSEHAVKNLQSVTRKKKGFKS